jgi:hypothetical protein
MNWYGIWALSRLGLAKDVYRLKLAEFERKQEARREGEGLAPAQELASV